MAPLSGSYEGIDPRGLFWSMAPLPEVAPAAGAVDTTRVDLVLQRKTSASLRTSIRTRGCEKSFQIRLVNGSRRLS
jgi:hypothetical protein